MFCIRHRLLVLSMGLKYYNGNKSIWLLKNSFRDALKSWKYRPSYMISWVGSSGWSNESQYNFTASRTKSTVLYSNWGHSGMQLWYWTLCGNSIYNEHFHFEVILAAWKVCQFKVVSTLAILRLQHAEQSDQAGDRTSHSTRLTRGDGAGWRSFAVLSNAEFCGVCKFKSLLVRLILPST